VIFSYFDDSSDAKREKHVAVGGIIGHEIWLNLFEGKWIEETKDLAGPFRSTDCECRHGQFSNWEKRDCDALMKRLVEVISDKETGLAATPLTFQFHSIEKCSQVATKTIQFD
jgi:hypothetical protein